MARRPARPLRSACGGGGGGRGTAARSRRPMTSRRWARRPGRGLGGAARHSQSRPAPAPRPANRRPPSRSQPRRRGAGSQLDSAGRGGEGGCARSRCAPASQGGRARAVVHDLTSAPREAPTEFTAAAGRAFAGKLLAARTRFHFTAQEGLAFEASLGYIARLSRKT